MHLIKLIRDIKAIKCFTVNVIISRKPDELCVACAEKLSTHTHRLRRAAGGVALDPGMIENLIVVTALKRLIPKEVNFLELGLADKV